jgi:hypothetical protein
MEAVTATLGFKLFLIAACLFAPVDKTEFKVECYEDNRQVFTMYAQRTETGYSLYSDKDMKSKPTTIVKTGSTFTMGDGRKARSIDNSKIRITPFKKNGSYKRSIGKAEVIFEYKKNVRKVYQDHSDKYFIVETVAQTGTHDKKHKKAASQRSCASNLKLINSAKDGCSMRKQLNKGAVVSLDQISAFIKGGFESCICPEGGKYTINPIGEKPNCSLKTHGLD